MRNCAASFCVSSSLVIAAFCCSISFSFAVLSACNCSRAESGRVPCERSCGVSASSAVPTRASQVDVFILASPPGGEKPGLPHVFGNGGDLLVHLRLVGDDGCLLRSDLSSEGQRG